MNSLVLLRCKTCPSLMVKHGVGGRPTSASTRMLVSRRRRLVHTTSTVSQVVRQSDVISSRWSNGTSIILRRQQYHHQNQLTTRGGSGTSTKSTSNNASSRTSRDSYYIKAKSMHSSIMMQLEQSSSSSSKPSSAQLKHLFFVSAVPMIGFGFMDNLIMIEAGSYIDTTLGARLGMSTLMAAALGQVVSDLSGVLFGGVVERSMMSLGILKTHLAPLTVRQRSLPIVKNVTMAGSAIGVVVGCLLGACTLLLHSEDHHGHHSNDTGIGNNSNLNMKTVHEMIQLHSINDIVEVNLIQVEGGTFNTYNDAIRDVVKEGKSIVQAHDETSSEILYAPILHKTNDKVLAIIVFDKSTGNTFDEDELKMANLLSKQVGVVLNQTLEKL